MEEQEEPAAPDIAASGHDEAAAVKLAQEQAPAEAEAARLAKEKGEHEAAEAAAAAEEQRKAIANAALLRLAAEEQARVAQAKAEEEAAQLAKEETGAAEANAEAEKDQKRREEHVRVLRPKPASVLLPVGAFNAADAKSRAASAPAAPMTGGTSTTPERGEHAVERDDSQRAAEPAVRGAGKPLSLACRCRVGAGRRTIARN